MRIILRMIVAVVTGLTVFTVSACGSTLPKNFDLRDENRVTGFKNQHQSGLCWAYATTAAAESSLITSGFENDSVDLSEAHICYCAYPFEQDRIEGSTVDGVYILGDKKTNIMFPFYAGGSSHVAAMLFAIGEGPVYEDVLPLETDVGDFRKSVDNMIALEGAGKLHNEMGDYLLISGKVYENDDDIKQAVMENGAAVTGIIIDPRCFGKDGHDELNYYGHDISNSSLETNHVVTIIGWDDGYSKHSFRNNPSRNGAWLIKDSTRSSNEGSDPGYFWMSYDEFHKDTAGMTFAKRDDYGQILSYDRLGPIDGLKTDGDHTTIANVFHVDNANELKAVGISTLAPGQEINVSIYRNPIEGQPDSGDLLYEKDYMIAYSGYEVIDLDETLSFGANDTFSVVVSYSNTKETAMVAPIEGDGSAVQIGALAELYLASSAGESFAYDGTGWYDLSDPASSAVFNRSGTMNNACIKALMQR